MKRRFELAGPPRQFWEITGHHNPRSGNVEIAWGTEGRQPQTHRRVVDNVEAYIAQQVADRLARGFVEVGTAMPLHVPESAIRLDRGTRCVAIALEPARAHWVGQTVHRYEGRLVDGRPLFEKDEGTVFPNEAASAAAFETEVARVLAEGYVPAGAFAPLAAALRPGARGCVARLAVTTRSLAIYQDGPRVVQLATTESGPLVEHHVCDGVPAALAQLAARVAGAQYNGYALLGILERPQLDDDPDLAARCLAEDSAAAWGVYADWLIGRGDPRGEIAQLRLAGHVAEAEALLAAHTDELFGLEGPVELTYRHGFARGATIAVGFGREAARLDDRVTTVLAAPIARFVDDLALGRADVDDNDWAPAVRAAIAAGRVLRALRLGGPEDADAIVGQLAFAWPRLPALELLAIWGTHVELGELRLPRLATLVRASAGLAASEVEAIGRALGRGWLPALRRLELSFGAPRDGCDATAEHLVRIFESEQLSHLGLVACPFVEEAVVGLVHSRALPRLATLELSGGATGLRALLRHADAFRHLQRLELAAVTPEVAAALPNAVSASERR